MKAALIVLLGLVLAVVLAQIVLSRVFLSEVARQERTVRGASVPVPRDQGEIPEAMRRFAERGLAGQGGVPRAVLFTQDVELLRGENWASSRARQHIATSETAFLWLAESPGWPVPAARVIDRYIDGEGLLEVRLLGALPVGRFEGPEADIGEAMRYLAELPWAPDAILANASIIWREVGEGFVEAELPLPSRPAIVRFRLDDAGDIVEITAQGRPAATGSEAVLRDWRGSFSDYGVMGGRRIPRRAEIGYVDDGVYAPYFRAQILTYDLLQ